MKSITVVIATYNGEKYILEQLKSILSQTVLPDEVLIFDDRSSDATADIIREFIKVNSLLNWRLYVNEENCGWKKNFMKGINSAKGDIIFCSDQDDIWFSQKIEMMRAVMEDDPNIKVLASSFEPIFESSSTIISKRILRKECSMYNTQSLLSKIRFDRNWLEFVKQGCMTCFDRQLLPYINAIWFDDCGHDAAIWCAGILLDCAYTINEPLIYFRRHEGNNTPKNHHNNCGRVRVLRIADSRIKNVMDKSSLFGLDESKEKLIEQLHSFYMERINAISSHSFMKLLGLLKFLKLYPSIKTWILDCVSAFR